MGSLLSRINRYKERALAKNEDAILYLDAAKRFVYGKRLLDIAKTTGNKDNEMTACFALAKTHQSLEQYDDAIVYGKRCVEVAKETGDKGNEMIACMLLAKAYRSLEQYDDAIVYGKRSLDIAEETGDKDNEINACAVIAKAHDSLEQYDYAIVYGKKCLDIAKETGDKENESNSCVLLGYSHGSLEQYDDTIVYGKRCLEVAKETGDKGNEMIACVLLGYSHDSLEQYDDAIVYGKRCLEVAKEIGGKGREMIACVLLANTHISQEQYDDAIVYGKRWLEIAKEIGDKGNEMIACSLLASAHQSQEQYDDAIVYVKRLLKIAIKTGDKGHEIRACAILSHIHLLLKLYIDGFLCLEEILKSETVSREAVMICEVALCNAKFKDGNETDTPVGPIKLSFCGKESCQYDNNIKHLHQIAEMEIDVLQNAKNAYCHMHIAGYHAKQGDREHAIRHYELALSYAKQCSSSFLSFMILCLTGDMHYEQDDIDKAISVLEEAVSHADSILLEFAMFSYGRISSDDNKIKCFNALAACHKLLSEAYIKKGNTTEALLQLEHCRGRLLLEQLLDKCSMTHEAFTEKEHLQYSDIKSFASTNKCSILFYFVFKDSLHRFLIEGERDPKVYTQTIKNCEAVIQSHVKNYLAEIGIRGLRVGPPSEGDDVSSMESECQRVFHMLFNGVTIDKLQENVIIIPDGPLFKVPFASLQNPDNQRYLYETKCIRILPSIRTLMLLENVVPVNNHGDALIIGNPQVGTVMFNKTMTEMDPLPHAEKEAEEIANLLGVEAFTGHKANKPSVLRKLKEMKPKLVHIASHGSLEKSTIALAPSYEAIARGFPREKEYMLTMREVQQANVHTQLAVLGCCHSGRGETPVEGVIGMCRAFLASGARAVVSSLWAIDDAATLEFMKIFYRNLKEKKSAGTSLRDTMKEMRETGTYSEPRYWAPFFLMGEDVTVDIE